ncbi:hypothetical protein BN1195_03618 [Chryseobacterium oranimense G311]|uniref:hypothetical protein n=1 Tax=Chryseobacterium oranimense TaxID=421058 RepID=UPI0005336EB7|nr:hypothetical protein [Chryseobacterium oranimense]CEJ71273.1 hypothetical protein BN1195_03618 [Chryseobacterium oranimense G311]DAG72864.1 MAG TPA: hypothetical protein [Caudoviricetes sp.]
MAEDIMMNETEAKIIHGLIQNDTRVRAVGIVGFITMLFEEGKCNEDLVKDVNHYVEMLSILYRDFQSMSIKKIRKKKNPIESKDFARLTKYHVELNALFDFAKQKMNVDDGA